MTRRRLLHRRTQAEEDLAWEIETHIELQTRKYRAAGRCEKSKTPRISFF
jgi:hypothetical protein